MSSVEEVVDALFRVLGHLASSALDLLDVKLRIPIISDIRGAIGVPEISSLDLFCWIAAEIDASQDGDKDLFFLEISAKVIHGAGHGVSDFLLFVATFASSAEALYLTVANPWGTPFTVLGIFVAGS
ncbi:uncharacterized protein UV8b_04508 [Ustilaginoidea virens]|uniref:Uncharacterized protein n=1 Tax=Ustilaginoidea virens TaxID=1159556 RepID=A0A8E5MHS7_USTVR|nr:uncharacterized protein UV8b_04508 [Ustilaginoidea virens]QUC20267.1 hypothetical protein UV8b_04508 [Ustilaginoidea virens]